MKRSYLDHAATSPMTEDVLASYVQALQMVGNPASTHWHGQEASSLLEQARFDVANMLGSDTAEVTFTSGGTESINIALKGMFWSAVSADAQRNVILLPTIEHHATLEAAEWLAQRQGAELVWLPVTAEGTLTADAVEKTINLVGGHRVAFITCMWANNEVGSISQIESICSAAKSLGVPVHVDAVAALGQVPINFHDSGATMLSLSAHKIGGPTGVGALIASRSAKSESLFHGGSQQRFRAGSQDVAGAVAFANALKLAITAERVNGENSQNSKMRSLRDKLIEGVKKKVPEAVLRGADHTVAGSRLPGNAHFTFPGCQGDSLLFLLDVKGVSVSVGSACQAGVQEISHVLLGMGLSEEEAIGSLRMTLGHNTTEAEIDHFLDNIETVVKDAQKAGITSIST
ncbi:MAG TPA: cysteine desulfurase family protein [Microbacteriaceae bacterium]|nr:cysteine desulfurase family protein [Microbacteriaceae bacterium]